MEYGSYPPINIEELIEIFVHRFWLRNGKNPTELFLGEVEYNELREICAGKNVSAKYQQGLLKADIVEYDGMSIIQNYFENSSGIYVK